MTRPTISILTCTFNNNLLTVFMLRRLLTILHFPYIPIIIIDNGNKISADSRMKRCFHVVDNFNNKLTPKYPFPSQNHAASIEYTLYNIINTDYVLLCDNDMKFYPSIINLLNIYDKYDAIGEIGYDSVPPNRLFPYLCIFNVQKMKRQNIHYFDINRIIRNGPDVHEPITSTSGHVYDTGYSFLMDIMHNNWNT